MTDFLKAAYAEMNENIKFGEAKSAALITLNSALFAGMISLVFSDKISHTCDRFLIAVLAVCLLIPNMLALLSFKAAKMGKKSKKTGKDGFVRGRIVRWTANRLKKDHEPNKPNYMFYKWIYLQYIHGNPTSTYLKDICKANVGKVGFDERTYLAEPDFYQKQLAKQIPALAEVAFGKFSLFNMAIQIEIWLFILLAAALVFIA